MIYSYFANHSFNKSASFLCDFLNNDNSRYQLISFNIKIKIKIDRKTSNPNLQLKCGPNEFITGIEYESVEWQNIVDTTMDQRFIGYIAVK